MRIILAGTGSAVGKTTIATGIMKALSEKYNVQPFKVGPDYIDPSYHTLATGNTSRNLDSFFMKEGQVRDSYLKGMEGKDIAVIEGVRGLYEGIDSINDIGSTASVAKSLEAPVILIINSRSLVKSAAALVLGFKALDPEINIAGVILNKVKNQNHYLKTKRSIEEITNTEVIGGIKRDDNISIEQRHLGLVPARERETSIKFIDIWSKTIKESIDLDRLVEIAKSAPKITSQRIPIWNRLNKQPVRIGDIGSNAQGQRVYSVRGKSVTISANGGGQGGSTGLYKIDLPDGDYIIRKLSPVECERLQTLPDNYTEGVSNTQRYKQLGNGWTVDVITHILKFIN